jgi:hypothetical protein
MITNNSAVLERMSKLLAIEALYILNLSTHLSLEGPIDPGANYRTRDGRGGRWWVLAMIERVRGAGRWRAGGGPCRGEGSMVQRKGEKDA